MFHGESKKTPLRITHGNSRQELKQNRPGLMRSFWEALFSDPQTAITLEIDPTYNVNFHLTHARIHDFFISAFLFRSKNEDNVQNEREIVLQSGLLALFILASGTTRARTRDLLQSKISY